MRLWHQSLIPLLPRQQLLGQHRECCAMRGNGWGKPHSVVNYVWTHDKSLLVRYHGLVMAEMVNRGYRVDILWYNPAYCGKIKPTDDSIEVKDMPGFGTLYPEHNDSYLSECLDNLKKKGITIGYPG